VWQQSRRAASWRQPFLQFSFGIFMLSRFSHGEAIFNRPAAKSEAGLATPASEPTKSMIAQILSQRERTQVRASVKKLILFALSFRQHASGKYDTKEKLVLTTSSPQPSPPRRGWKRFQCSRSAAPLGWMI